MKRGLLSKRPFRPIHTFLSILLFWSGFSPAHGQNWESSPSGSTQTLNGVFITSDGTGAVAVGNGGTVLSFDGTNWLPVPGAPAVDFIEVHGTRTDYFVAGGIDELWFCSNGVWNVLATNAPGDYAYTPVHVSSNESNIWWQQLKTYSGGFPFSFFASTGNDWLTAHQTPMLAFAADGDDVRIVDQKGNIQRADATLLSTNLFTNPDLLFNNLTAAWFVPDNLDEIFAIYNESDVYHFNGLGWTDMNAGLTERLIWLGGTATNDVYVIGVNETTGDGIMHYFNGSEWSAVTLPPGINGLIDIAFLPATSASPLTISTEALSSAPGFNAIAVGENGRIIFLRRIAAVYVAVFVRKYLITAAGSMSLLLSALAPGQSYTVQKTASLEEIVWQTVTNGIPTTGSPVAVSLAITAAAPQMFIRALSSTNAPAQ